MLTFICANCGGIAKNETIESIDTGTCLLCPKCGKYTIIYLLKSEELNSVCGILKNENKA